MPKRPRRRFRRTPTEPFQPLRIFSQILALQASYYLLASILIVFTALVAGATPSLSLIFSWTSVRGDTTVGWTLSVVWMLCAVLMIIALVLVVARSKLVLDFALTVHGVHFLIVWLFDGEVPKSLLWWGLQAGSALVMVAGGTWACRWRELRPMTFGVAEDGGEAGYEMVSVKDEDGRGGRREGTSA